MEIGIIGLPRSGKTTIFNALTKGKAETGAYTSDVLAPNIGVTKVPDPRLEMLADIFKPQKIVPAEVKYVDIALPHKPHHKEDGLDEHIISYLSNVDALIHVVRAFQNENVPHIEESIDAERDMATIELELAFSDLALIGKRMERIKTSLKGAKQSEREAGLREIATLEKIKASLEDETPIREQGLTEETARLIENYRFLTAKPLLVLINIGEEQISQASELEDSLRSRYTHPKSEIAVLCGKPEMELAQLDTADAQEFRSAMGLDQFGLDRLINLSYNLLGLVSFFTTRSNEVKAWTIHTGSTALKAAGKIHSDIERGFIRAEVIGHNSLVECGSVTEARKRGLTRLEGKNYIIQDGVVVTFLFNV